MTYKPCTRLIALAVQLLLLAGALVSAVNAKSALGGYQPDFEVALADVASKSLNVLDIFLDFEAAALGCCIGPDNNLNGAEGGGNITTPENNLNAPNNVLTTIAPKIEKQMGKRGWDRASLDETISNPHRTVTTRDTRHNPNTGSRNDDPAIAYINSDGSYVVRNSKTGDIIQVSDRTDPNWKSPFE